MKIAPLGTDSTKIEGSAAGGLQTKGLHAWRVATVSHVRAQKPLGVSKDDLWKELSPGTNIGQRKILSKVLSEEFK